MRTLFTHVKSIITGWWRFLFRKKSPRAKDRLSMCSMCELKKGRFCGVCWCELDALAELDPEELGVCKHPNGSKWTLIDFYWKYNNGKREYLFNNKSKRPILNR